MKNITFLIPVWFSDEYAQQLKKQLIQQGVDSSQIVLMSEKESRAKVLNRYIQKYNTEYICLCDDDVIISDNAVAQLYRTIEKYPNFGMVLAPTIQVSELTKPKPRLVSVPDEQALENTSARMWSFNFTLIRNFGIKFDEDYFGSQLIDWDIGLEYLKKGYLSIIDHRTAVAHKQTVYDSKSLCYHAVVARSRHIFMRKWQNHEYWTNVEDWNKANNHEIPTLEQITHMSENDLIKYICQFEQGGLNIWFQARFGNNETLNKYLNNIANTGNNTKSLFNPIISDMNAIPILK